MSNSEETQHEAGVVTPPPPAGGSVDGAVGGVRPRPVVRAKQGHHGAKASVVLASQDRDEADPSADAKADGGGGHRSGTDWFRVRDAAAHSAEHVLMLGTGLAYLVFGVLLYFIPEIVMPLVIPEAWKMAISGDLESQLGIFGICFSLLIELGLLYIVAGYNRNSVYNMNSAVHRVYFAVVQLVLWAHYGLIQYDVPLALIPPDVVITAVYLFLRYRNAVRSHYPDWAHASPLRGVFSGSCDNDDAKTSSPRCWHLTIPGMFCLVTGLLGSTPTLITIGLSKVRAMDGTTYAGMTYISFALLAIIGYHDVASIGDRQRSSTAAARCFTSLVIRPLLFAVTVWRYHVPIVVSVLMLLPGVLGSGSYVVARLLQRAHRP